MERRTMHVWLLTLVLACAGCQALRPRVSYSGGDGSAPEKAVVVQASDSEAAIRAEHEWIAAHHPGARVLGQRLGGHDGKAQDVLTVRLASGEERELFFDVSAFYGKLW